MRNLIRGYFYRHKKLFITNIVLFVVFLITALLYSLPKGVVIYPAVVAFVVNLLIVIKDIFDYKEEIEKLDKMQNVSDLDDFNTPSKDEINNSYQKIILKLLLEKKNLVFQEENKYQQMIDYYTMWTHQIKTPISSMFLKMENDQNDNLELESDLLTIERYVDMAINYLKLDGDNIDFIFKEYSIDKMLRESIRKYSNDFIMRKINLVYETIDKKVLTDEKWFCFIIEQILSNSLKYTNEGFIRIYINDEGQLCLQDSGVGIIESDLKRIFEKGFTGFNGRNDKKASGIGLYITKKVCNKLNIGISVESQVNQGTTVFLTFNNQIKHWE